MLKLFINLDRSTARKEQLEKLLVKQGLRFERVSAVDGKNLDDELVKEIQYSRFDYDIRSRYTRLLTKAEIGCFLSHRKCWQKLIDSHENFAIIIEDALKISKRAQIYLNSSKWIPSGVDIVRLNCFEPDEMHIIAPKSIELTSGDQLICQLKPKPLGTQGYIISRKAAEFALKHSEKIPCPVDDFLFTPLFEVSKHFSPWQINPCIICKDTSFSSDIGNRTNKNLKALKAPFYIRHGLRRFLLKQSINTTIKKGIKMVLTFAD